MHDVCYAALQGLMPSSSLDMAPQEQLVEALVCRGRLDAAAAVVRHLSQVTCTRARHRAQQQPRLCSLVFNVAACDRIVACCVLLQALMDSKLRVQALESPSSESQHHHQGNILLKLLAESFGKSCPLGLSSEYFFHSVSPHLACSSTF